MKYDQFPQPQVNLQQMCLEGLENVLSEHRRLRIVQDVFVGEDTNVVYPDFGEAEPPEAA